MRRLSFHIPCSISLAVNCLISGWGGGGRRRRGGMSSHPNDERRVARGSDRRGGHVEEERPARRARDRRGVDDHLFGGLLMGCMVIPHHVVGQRDREDDAAEEDGTVD